MFRAGSTLWSPVAVHPLQARLHLYNVHTLSPVNTAHTVHSLHCKHFTRCTHRTHWRQPNLYSKAIELVCGGSPIGCVLVERKAQNRGKWEQQQHRTSLDQLLVQHKCTVMGKINGKYLQLPFPTLQGPSPLQSTPDWESRRWLAFFLGVGEDW